MAKSAQKKRGSPANLAIDASKQTEFNQKIQKVKEEIKEGSSEPGVVYISHLPWGFEEKPLRDYFKQFGTVKKIRVSRSKKTGGSRGYAYIQFAKDEVAKIVSETMNNYLMFGKLIKCKHLENPHPHTFKHANRKFIKPAARQHAIQKHNSFKSDTAVERSQKKVAAKLQKLKQQLAAKKINFKFEDMNFDTAKKSPKKSATEKKEIEKGQTKRKSAKKVIDVDKEDSDEEEKDDDSGVEVLSTKKSKGKKVNIGLTTKKGGKGFHSVADEIDDSDDEDEDEEEQVKGENSDQSSEGELEENDTDESSEESEDSDDAEDEDEDLSEDISNEDEIEGEEDESSDETSSDEVSERKDVTAESKSKKYKGLKTPKIGLAKSKKLELEKSAKKTPGRLSLIPKEVDTPTGKMNVLIEDSSEEEIDFKTPPNSIKSSKLDDTLKSMQRTPLLKTSPKRKINEQLGMISNKKPRFTPGSAKHEKKGKDKSQSPKDNVTKKETVTPKSGARFVRRAQSEKKGGQQGNKHLKTPPSHKKRRSFMN